MNTEQQHQQIIEQFYTAFQQLDANGMTAHYDDDVVFEDPVFGRLRGKRAVGGMWRMLIDRGKNSLKINFHDVVGTATGGQATWEADYLFGKKSRPVHNVIHARFVISDGRIIKHSDQFNFQRWAGMSIGTTGKILSFTPFFRNKIRKNARAALEKYTR
ncbi:MAG: nuclear transport factor 2 family protein [Cyclobacteriaceae bacterium]